MSELLIRFRRGVNFELLLDCQVNSSDVTVSRLPAEATCSLSMISVEDDACMLDARLPRIDAEQGFHGHVKTSSEEYVFDRLIEGHLFS